MKLSPTLWEDIQSYLFYDAQLSQKKGNVSTLKSLCKQFVNYFSSTDFNRPNFTNYLSYLASKGLSKQTRDNHLKMAKHIDKYLSINITGYIRCLEDYKFIKDKRIIVKDTLTVEEIKRLVQVDSNDIDDTLTFFLCETAARSMEALTLTWDALIDESGEYHVIFRDPKNNEDREIPILKHDLWDKLQKLPRTCEYVFPAPNDNTKIMSNQRLGDMIHRRATAARINKRVYPHLLRHTWAVLAKNSGMSVGDVQRILGHSDLNTTAKYFNVSLEQKRRAMSTHILNKEKLSVEKLKNMIQEHAASLLEGTGYSLDALTLTSK
jgi:integrase/recombinase XerD